jgi:hypothetical protein
MVTACFLSVSDDCLCSLNMKIVAGWQTAASMPIGAAAATDVNLCMHAGYQLFVMVSG